jgi:signal transduction histidine kinase
VHPAILSQGLDAALTSLAEEAPIAVTVEAGQLPPIGPAVEVAVYRTVAAVLGAATKSGASHLAVRVQSADGRVEVEIGFDGDAPEALPLRVADRIGAVGGDFELRSVAGAGVVVHAVLPCG